MNEKQKLERVKRFFCSLRSRWKWALLALVAAAGGIWLLVNTEQEDAFWLKLVSIAVVAAVVFFLFWFSSLFIVNYTKKRLTEYNTNGGYSSGKPEGKIGLSFSRLLSVGERWQALIDLRELCDYSSFCFRGAAPSYVRIQWLRTDDLGWDDPRDVVKSWPKNNKIIYDVPFSEFGTEKTRLWISRKCDEDGEYVEAFLTSPDVIETNSEEYANAERVPLMLNEPCLLAYEVIEENPDGTQTRKEEQVGVITWIGGNG